jgi:hypothetical protein
MVLWYISTRKKTNSCGHCDRILCFSKDPDANPSPDGEKYFAPKINV